MKNTWKQIKISNLDISASNWHTYIYIYIINLSSVAKLNLSVLVELHLPVLVELLKAPTVWHQWAYSWFVCICVGLSASVSAPLHRDSQTLAEEVWIGPPWPDPSNNPTDACPNWGGASPAHLRLVFDASLSAIPSPSLPGWAALQSPPGQQEQTSPMNKNKKIRMRISPIQYSNHITFPLCLPDSQNVWKGK